MREAGDFEKNEENGKSQFYMLPTSRDHKLFRRRGKMRERHFFSERGKSFGYSTSLISI